MRLEFQSELDHYLQEAKAEHVKILKAEHDKYLEEKREREKVWWPMPLESSTVCLTI
jgi:hypothetical protein